MSLPGPAGRGPDGKPAQQVGDGTAACLSSIVPCEQTELAECFGHKLVVVAGGAHVTQEQYRGKPGQMRIESEAAAPHRIIDSCLQSGANERRGHAAVQTPHLDRHQSTSIASWKVHHGPPLS
jgi:hypothetical protein